MKFNMQKSAMFIELKNRVDMYLKLNSLSETGDWRLYIKTIFWLTVFLASYNAVVFFPPERMWLRIVLCIVHGISWAGIGFNIVHDAAHGAYSKDPKWNKRLSYLFDVVGVSNFMWKPKHNIAHHTLPNVENEDDDIDTMGLILMSPNQKWRWYHRFQVIYAIPLYSLLYIAWVWKKDFEKYVKRFVANTNIPKMSRGDKFTFWFFKILYFITYILIPCLIYGWIALIGYLIAAGVCGITISIVFQLAHIVRNTKFPIPIDGKINSDFYLHQIMTTSDFAVRNRVISWFVGGLNFQVIHHIFPRISHVHYPAIQKIAIRVFREYGVPYNSYRTMTGAIILGHFGHLWDMSKKPKVYPI